MKYEVGDIVRTTKDRDRYGVEVFPIGTLGEITDIIEDNLPYTVRVNNDYWNYSEDMIELVNAEKIYEQGSNDTWELVKKSTLELSHNENEKVFGRRYIEDILKEMTPQEALAKLKAYEEEQEHARLEEMKRIKVGSVVVWSGVKAVVMDEDGVGNVALFTENGCIEDWIDLKNVTNTGKHIEVKSFLEQIREV